MSVTDEIKSRIDIVSYVQRHVPTLKKAGRNHKACCPFHNEKTPSFVVNPARQSWHCFGACAEGGDLFTFAQKMHNWDFKEALRELASEAGVQLEAQTPAQKDRIDHQERLRGIAASATEFYQRELLREFATGVRQYLTEQRGLSKETILDFQLGYAPDSWDFMLRSLRGMGHNDDEIVEVGLAVRNENGRVYDRFRNRLMIPIRDDRGRAVGFGGRALGDEDGAKYINSPQSALFDKSRLLFGLDRGKSAIRDSGTAVIVEGYMDVIQAHQAGHFNVVAQMGTAMTEPQIRLVSPRYAKRIVLALDADAAGQNAARRSLEVARQALSEDFAGKLSIDIGILQIPAGKDPDDYLRESPEGWAALVESAQGVADFVIEMETASLSENASLPARQAAAEAILPILFASENNVYRQENIQKLARRLRIGEREMLAWTQGRIATERKQSRAAPVELEPPEMPPEYWDNEHEVQAPDESAEGETAGNASAAGRPVVPLKRAIEAYCLSELLKNPSLFYQVNRKLRELAGDDQALLNGPLCELGADDFTQSQYRALMAYFQDSMAQDDLEPLEYLGREVDDDLLADFRALLVDEPETISDRIRGNFQVDLNDIFRKGSYRGRPGMSMQDELVCRALHLRLERLENERVEMQYLQEEAQAGNERDIRQRELFSERIMLSLQAKARINVAVS